MLDQKQTRRSAWRNSKRFHGVTYTNGITCWQVRYRNEQWGRKDVAEWLKQRHGQKRIDRKGFETTDESKCPKMGE